MILVGQLLLKKGICSTRNLHLIYNFELPSIVSFIALLVSSLSYFTIPRNVAKVLAHPKWRQTMIVEIQGLWNSSTWELVSLLLGKMIVGYWRVYTIKVGLNGEVNHHWARLVIKGYIQNIYGLDYCVTFSSLAGAFFLDSFWVWANGSCSSSFSRSWEVNSRLGKEEVFQNESPYLP